MDELLEVLDFVEKCMTHSKITNAPINGGYYEAMREVSEMINGMVDERARDIIGV